MKYKFSNKIKSFKKNRRSDGIIIILTLALLLLGLICIATASSPMASRNYNNQYYFVILQLRSVGVGLFLMFLFSRIDYRLLKKYSPVILLAAFIMLFFVLIPGIGVKVSGARRWINLGFTSVQPSEIAKLALIIYMASLASSGKQLLAYIIPIGLFCSMVMLQPDMGTAIVLTSVSFAQLYASGENIKNMATTAMAGAAGGLLLILTSSYRRSRLLTYFGGVKDPLGESYHINQVLYALGSGGLTGVGFGQSRQKHLFLPETATDSIFPIIAEELGFFGASFIIVLLFILVYKLIVLSMKIGDPFAKVFVFGVASWIGIQTILNIGSMVAIVPLTGIPLPFISYGGSSIIALLSALGITINISNNAPA